MAATDETQTQTDGTARTTADVRLVRVTKTFGDTLAVDDISLTIEDGQFFSLLGPSGCGKTTTLSMIGGFEDPTAGAIYLGGVEVSSQPAYRRDVNTVFQSYALFPHLDVFENVAFGLRRRRVAKDEIKSRVEDILRLVDLPGYERRKPGQLSGGQQQRVALARALVNRPKLLLLDEPLGALDLKLRKQMQLELKRIQTEVGITFLYVTHDQEEAMVMSDRLAVMSGGRIEQVGPPEDVYDRPATKFVAGFLGASNLIAGDVVGHEAGDAVVKLENGSTVRLPADRLSPPLAVGDDRRPPREDQRGRAGRRRPGRLGRLRGDDRDDRLHRGLAPIHGERAGRPGIHRLHPERGRRRRPAPGGSRPADVGPAAHIRRRGRRFACGDDARRHRVNEHPKPPPGQGLDIDQALLRGLTESRSSRRGFLKASAGVVGLAPLLAACGVAGTAASGKKNKEFDWTAWWHRQKPTNQLVFANWPYYIDTTPRDAIRSLDTLHAADRHQGQLQGGHQRQPPFYAKIAPGAAGQASRPARTSSCITNGAQLYAADRQRLARSRCGPSMLPNFTEVREPTRQEPVLRPGEQVLGRWQSGFTGIAYNPKLTGRETRPQRPLGPQAQGHVGMMSDNTELGSIGLLKLGIEPVDVDTRRLEQGGRTPATAEDERIRRYYDQGYINDARERRHLDHAGVVGRHLPRERIGLPGAEVRRPG